MKPSISFFHIPIPPVWLCCIVLFNIGWQVNRRDVCFGAQRSITGTRTIDFRHFSHRSHRTSSYGILDGVKVPQNLHCHFLQMQKLVCMRLVSEKGLSMST